MVTMVNCNKSKAMQTASADKYPNGYFKEKPCRCCKAVFLPNAPSELYCNDVCKDKGIMNAYLLRNYKITFRLTGSCLRDKRDYARYVVVRGS